MKNKKNNKGPVPPVKLKFSVVTVAFNSEDVIEKTIASVLNQTLPPYEYFVIDGASSDKTVEIARGFSNQFAQKGVKYTIISEKDTGTYNAMNKGVRAATGDFISFLNSGDWYEPDALENIEKFYIERAFELTYGGIKYITPDGRIVKKMSRLDHFLISTRNWNHPSMFLKTEICQKYGFDEKYSIYADLDLYLKLRKDGTQVRVIQKIIASFVTGGVSSDTDFQRTMIRTAEKYRVYRANGYGPIYLLECYGWAWLKNIYILLHRKRGNV